VLDNAGNKEGVRWYETLLMTPAAWQKPFDLKLQTYLYEVYHTHWANRAMHLATMGPIVWCQFLLLPLVWRWAWALALAAYYVACVGGVVGAALGAVALGMCKSADFVEKDGFAVGCVVGLSLLQTVTHRLEDRVPPVANGSRRQWTQWKGASPLRLARNFVIGVALEFLASPKLLAVQAIIVVNTVRPTTCWWTQVRDVVRVARRDPNAPIDRVPALGDLVADHLEAGEHMQQESITDDDDDDDGTTTTTTTTTDAVSSSFKLSEQTVLFVLASLLLPFVVALQVVLGLLVRIPPASEEQCGGPEPAVLENVDEMRRYVRRSEPFVVKGLAAAILDELQLPPSSCPSRRGEIAVDHDPREFPTLHAFVRRLFGRWRWMLSHKPLWFTGAYDRGSAHIDFGIPSVNFYCLKRGSKRVVLFPAAPCAGVQDDLVLGSDQLFLPGSDETDTFEAWLHDAKAKTNRPVYDFHLHAGEALFFNSSASLHQLTNLESDCAAYSIRLTALAVSPLVKSALVWGPFRLRWQTAKHSLADILRRRTTRVVGEP